jgi:hypothetical protein
MGLESHESVNDGEALRLFLEDFESINEYFHIIDRDFPRKKSGIVKITRQHLTFEDLMDEEKRLEYGLASADMEGVWVPLVVKRQIEPRFKIGDYRYRIGIQSHIDAEDRKIYVRLLMFDYIDPQSSHVISTDYWIYRYVQDME